MENKDGSLIFRRIFSHKLIPVSALLSPYPQHRLECDMHLVITEALILNVSLHLKDGLTQDKPTTEVCLMKISTKAEAQEVRGI